MKQWPRSARRQIRAVVVAGVQNRAGELTLVITLRALFLTKDAFKEATAKMVGLKTLKVSETKHETEAEKAGSLNGLGRRVNPITLE